MATLESSTPAQKRVELRRAVVELRERGLSDSAKWAAELMAGTVPPPGQPICAGIGTTHAQSQQLASCAGLPAEASSSRPHQASRHSDNFLPSTSGSLEEDDTYLLAKTVFDMRVSSRHRRLAMHTHPTPIAPPMSCRSSAMLRICSPWGARYNITDSGSGGGGDVAGSNDL